MYEATTVYFEAVLVLLPLSLAVGAAMLVTMLGSDKSNAARMAAEPRGKPGGAEEEKFSLGYWKPDGTKVSEAAYGERAAHRRFFELEGDGRTVHIEPGA